MVVKVQNKDQLTGKNMKKTTKEYSGKKQKSNSRNESENDERNSIS